MDKFCPPPMALAADILQCTFGNDSVIPSTIAAMLNLSLSSFLSEKKFCTTVIIIQGLDNGHVFVIPERRTKEGLALLCAATSFHNFEMGFMSRYWIHVAAFISNNEQGRACTIHYCKSWQNIIANTLGSSALRSSGKLAKALILL